jgi:hypothetical protein
VNRASPRRRGLALLACATLLFGCRDQATVPPEPEPKTEPEPVPEPVDCGPVGERFVDYDWVPADARLLMVIDRESADLPAALTRLRGLTEGAATIGLPVRATLALGQLGMQSQMLALSLARLELAPAELIELHGPGSEIAWVWPTQCEPERVAARVLARWGVLLRANLDAKLGPGDPERFPFDVVVLADDRIALTPLGRGSALLRWLRTAEGDVGPGSRLGELAPAPIRAVIQGESLLVGDDQADHGSGLAHTRTLRVDADRVELDGELWTQDQPE